MSRANAITLGALIATAVTHFLSANPGIPPPDDSHGDLVYPLLFLLEGLLIALMARGSSVRLLRFVLVWTVITTVTFILLFILLATRDGKLAFLIATIGGEIGVVLVEACCIAFLLRRAFWARNPQAALSLRRCLVYSFIVNLVSLAGGALALML